MVAEKIRRYREFKGLNQIQLAELSGINVGTIRKYEIGLRNPKPDQLEKIATALGFNVSVFLDLNIETAGDVLSLLFLIDEITGLKLSEESLSNGKKTVRFDFENPTLQDFIEKWCEFKNIYEKERLEILSIEDYEKRQKELEKIEDTYTEWKLRAMATTIGCHTIVKKGVDKDKLSITDLT